MRGPAPSSSRRSSKTSNAGRKKCRDFDRLMKRARIRTALSFFKCVTTPSQSDMSGLDRAERERPNAKTKLTSAEIRGNEQSRASQAQSTSAAHRNQAKESNPCK